MPLDCKEEVEEKLKEEVKKEAKEEVKAPQLNELEAKEDLAGFELLRQIKDI